MAQVFIAIEWWQAYQDLLKQAVVPLTADQLALRLGAQPIRPARSFRVRSMALRRYLGH